MAYWCEFKPAYGFHEGFVHPYPHTHGCVRLHKEAAARLFALTNRHACAYRELPAGRQGIWQPGPKTGSEQGPRSTACVHDVASMVY